MVLAKLEPSWFHHHWQKHFRQGINDGEGGWIAFQSAAGVVDGDAVAAKRLQIAAGENGRYQQRTHIRCPPIRTVPTHHAVVTA